MIFSSYSEGREELAGIRLVSCGHIFAKSNREINRPLGREDWLLFYVAKEQETFFFECPVTARAGAFVLFAPHEKQHHVYLGNKTAEFYYVHFRCDSLPPALALATSQVHPLSPQPQYVTLFEEIIEETLQKNPCGETLSVTRLMQLLALIRREVCQISQPVNGGWKSVAFAIQHMNRSCDSNLSLEEYASMCCMSKFHFLRVFREVTGATPLDYRNRIRIEHAKELLESSTLSVSEIALSLGFSSPAYFSDRFKRAVGIPPALYRTLSTQA